MNTCKLLFPSVPNYGFEIQKEKQQQKKQKKQSQNKTGDLTVSWQICLLSLAFTTIPAGLLICSAAVKIILKLVYFFTFTLWRTIKLPNLLFIIKADYFLI